MSDIKINLEIPQSVYDKLGSFIEQKVAEAFNAKADELKKQSVKLTREEAAKALRISLPTLDKLRTEGTLPYQQIGKRILITQQAIDNYLNRSI